MKRLAIRSNSAFSSGASLSGEVFCGVGMMAWWSLTLASSNKRLEIGSFPSGLSITAVSAA